MARTQNSSPLNSDAQQIKKQKSREKEYKRCRTVNEAFDTLQQKIPFLNPEERKQLPKIKTLRLAMQYITHLNKLLDGDAKTTTLTNETRPLTHSDFRNTVTEEMKIRNSYRERAHSEEMDQETVQRILTRERSRRRGSCNWSLQERDFLPQNFPMATEIVHQQSNVFNGNYLPSTYPMVPSYSMTNSVENQENGYYFPINYGYQY
ncbi:unnamed protein product [Caenorhabditis brenneri]